MRGVPRRYRSVEPRVQVWISLHTDSIDEARTRSEKVWDEQIAGWERLLEGDAADAQARFDAAREIAQSTGDSSRPVEDVRTLPVPELLARIEASLEQDAPHRTKAGLRRGTVPEPAMTVTRALTAFLGLAANWLVGKSEDQVRRWETARKKAIRNFVDVAGDRNIAEITSEDMQDFRDALFERVRAGEITASSANKDLGNLADVLSTVNKQCRLGLDLPVRRWSRRENEKRTRPAFSTTWITSRLLAPGALEGLNLEARCILIGMVNTGYRPSEAQNLGADQIRLDADIPHISIEPIGRTPGTRNVRRTIPLLGVSLEAFRLCPQGFPRYWDAADVAKVIDAFLADSDLRETPETTCYGLRHSFQERMIAARVDDRVRRDIFGHALSKETYGDVPLDVKRDALLPVAL